MAYEEIVSRFGNVDDAGLRELVAAALLSKGRACFQLDDLKRAVSTLDDIVVRFRRDTNHLAREAAADALVEKAKILHESGNFVDEIDTYDQVAKIFGRSTRLDARTYAARAMVAKAETLFSQMGETDRAAQICDELVRTLGSADEPKLQNFSNRAKDLLEEINLIPVE